MMAELYPIKTVQDRRGSLSVLERLPFGIKRVYYLHGIDIGAMRGGHAHKKLDRIMVAVKGSFKVTINDGPHWNDYAMSDPTVGLRIRPKEWVEVSEFSEGAVCLVLASEEHDEKDCIRDFSVLARFRRSRDFCDCRQGRDPCSCERSVQ